MAFVEDSTKFLKTQSCILNPITRFVPIPPPVPAIGGDFSYMIVID